MSRTNYPVITFKQHLNVNHTSRIVLATVIHLGLC